MKIPALITVVALACGSAFAANTASVPPNPTVSAPADSQAGTGVVAKTKRALHRMGAATRNTMHRIANAGHRRDDSTTYGNAASSDTRSMGASGADGMDAGRRTRMDEAYRNYQSKQNR